MKFAPILLCLLLAVGCSNARRGEANTTAAPGINMIRDLETLPQDCNAYLDANADDPLVAPEVQAKLAADYRKKFFAPWHEPAAMTVEQVQADFSRTVMQKSYGENAQPVAGKRKEVWGRLGDDPPDATRISKGLFGKYPVRAIAIRNSNLRLLPSLSPRFKAPIDDPMNGFPFDTLQESSVAIGTPVMIVAGFGCAGWAYVQAPFASGWIQAQDLAIAGESFIQEWEKPALVSPPCDDLFYSCNEGGPPTAYRGIGIGVLLPCHGGRACCIPAADGNGFAMFVRAFGCQSDDPIFPLDLTPSNLAAVANQMLGQPYGWGGMYEQRDCSSTLRDLFTPFGVWLPRNSGAQAKAGAWTSFEGLTGEQKEKLILEKGRPWRTMIHYPGHIMLYIGVRDGRAIILHNFWGLATRDAAGAEGRFVIGRCVITTLQPGIERTDLMPGKGDLRQRIDGMTILKLNAADEQK